MRSISSSTNIGRSAAGTGAAVTLMTPGLTTFEKLGEDASETPVTAGKNSRQETNYNIAMSLVQRPIDSTKYHKKHMEKRGSSSRKRTLEATANNNLNEVFRLGSAANNSKSFKMNIRGTSSNSRNKFQRQVMTTKPGYR